MSEMRPDPKNLLTKIQLTTPLVGIYDAPELEPFEPLVVPKTGTCVFSFYKNWTDGKTLHLTKEHFGCGGAGRWMWGLETRTRQNFIKFLVDHEGLKASYELMEKWIDSSSPYRATYSNIFIGPLKDDQWECAKSIAFFVNPDQLSILMIGAQYRSTPDDAPSVIAPFGSGCSELLPFKDLNISQASIGATDIAMRQYLPPDILAFVVTKPMFKQLCALDERSFLYKSFLQNLKKARGLPDY